MGRIKFISAAKGAPASGGGSTGLITMPAGALSPDGATFAQVEKGGRLFDVFQFSGDGTTDDSVFIDIVNDGSITTPDFAIELGLFIETDEATDNTVKFKAEAIFIGSDDELGDPYGRDETFTGDLSDASVLTYLSSPKVTAGNETSIAGSVLRIKITRLSTDVADDLAQTVSLYSCAISINQ